MLGPLIKKYRKGQNLSQKELYTGIIGERQAIRFEQGAADLKATDFLTIMTRLELDLETILLALAPENPQWQAQLAYENLVQNAHEKDKSWLTFYQRYRQRPEKYLRRLAITAKKNYWVDSDLTSDELAEIRDFYQKLTQPTMQQMNYLQTLVSLENSLDPWSLFLKNEKFLLRFKAHPAFAARYRDLCVSFFYLLLFNRQPDQAAACHERLLAQHFSENLEQELMNKVRTQYLKIVRQEPQAEADLYQLLGVMRQLALPRGNRLCDAIIDNTRHILQNYGLHQGYTEREIGAILRFALQTEKVAKKDMVAYLKQIPDLYETFVKVGKPLAYYLDKY